MKHIQMLTDFDYHPHPRVTWRFHAGVTYARVIEAAAKQIVKAGAGVVVSPPSSDTGTTGNENAWAE